MKNKIRRVLLTICLMALVAVVSVGATLAYLKAVTSEIQNTFTGSDIEITLTETWNTDGDDDEELDSWSAQLIPSKEYKKDPVVAVVDSTNVDVYLFVKYTANACEEYLDYTMAWSGWTLLEERGEVEDGSVVYYREVKVEDDEKSWALIQDNTVTVKEELEESKLANAKTTMDFKAYAIQIEGFEDDVVGAWNEISEENVVGTPSEDPAE